MMSVLAHLQAGTTSGQEAELRRGAVLGRLPAQMSRGFGERHGLCQWRGAEGHIAPRCSARCCAVSCFALCCALLQGLAMCKAGLSALAAVMTERRLKHCQCWPWATREREGHELCFGRRFTVMEANTLLKMQSLMAWAPGTGEKISRE